MDNAYKYLKNMQKFILLKELFNGIKILIIKIIARSFSCYGFQNFENTVILLVISFVNKGVTLDLGMGVFPNRIIIFQNRILLENSKLRKQNSKFQKQNSRRDS